LDLSYACLFSQASNQIGVSQQHGGVCQKVISLAFRRGVLIAWHQHYFNAEELGLHVA
jgi:hypothetical protein